MERIFLKAQLVVSLIILACVVIEVVAHTVMGNITSLLGFIVSAIFLLLSWKLVSISWEELKTEKNK